VKIKRILVPVDYSEQSQEVVNYAVDFAELLEAHVELVHVASPPVEYLPLDKWIFGEERSAHSVEQKVRDAARKAFDEFLEALPRPIRGKLTSRLEMGIPSKVIAEVLRQEDYDLVIMGTHGRTGTGHALLGSTTARVIRRTACPVLTVPRDTR
jgi:nucleotide-binding universal stress UspA family protein